MAWKLKVEPGYSGIRGVMGEEARIFVRLLKNYMPKLGAACQQEEEEGGAEEGEEDGRGLFWNVTSEGITQSITAKLDNNWRQPIWRGA